MRKSAATRACIFATIHKEATILLMDLMEESGLSTMIGKVNMDRNSPDYLRSRQRKTQKKRPESGLKWWLTKITTIQDRSLRHGLHQAVPMN